MSHTGLDPDPFTQRCECGYDLRGTSGPRCPECGRLFPAPPRPRDTRGLLEAAACLGCLIPAAWIIFGLAGFQVTNRGGTIPMVAGLPYAAPFLVIADALALRTHQRILRSRSASFPALAAIAASVILTIALLASLILRLTGG